jgi:hypothetical protein
MELEIVEAGFDAEPEGCPKDGFIIGCCIFHFWDWAAGLCGTVC